MSMLSSLKEKIIQLYKNIFQICPNYNKFLQMNRNLGVEGHILDEEKKQ